MSVILCEISKEIIKNQRDHTMNNKLSFSSDYMEGAHPEILRRLETNLENQWIRSHRIRR